VKRKPVVLVLVYRDRDGWRFRTKDEDGRDLKDSQQAFNSRSHAERIARGRYPNARIEFYTR
jgi:hypothetical protein